MDNKYDTEVAKQDSSFAHDRGHGGVHAGTANQLNRDSRLDALTRQSHELSKMASVVAERAYQMVERLDGPRPVNERERGDGGAVKQPDGYINSLQASFNETRMSLDAVSEYLNELDNLV
jgi:hypothetical protein